MKPNKQAFTLIELLVVVLIIGILASIALPQYQKTVERSRAVQALTSLKTLVQAEEAYYLTNGIYSQPENLDIDLPELGNGWSASLVNFPYGVDSTFISVYKTTSSGMMYFGYYLGSKEYMCMCDNANDCKLCASFPHTKQDCHALDKNDGYECYYLN